LPDDIWKGPRGHGAVLSSGNLQPNLEEEPVSKEKPVHVLALLNAALRAKAERARAKEARKATLAQRIVPRKGRRDR
jgi:hypothetical protein